MSARGPWLVPALRALERISPVVTARLVAPLMWRTRRPAAATRKHDVYQRAERFTLRSGKERLAVFRWGERGPVVLLAHGWNGYAAQLAAFVEPLLGAGFRVVAFDAPGHGDSGGAESSLVHFADALETVVAHVTQDAPLAGIIAHSFGGAAVVFALARKDGLAGTSASLARARLVFIAAPIDIHDFARSFSAAMGLGDATRGELNRIIERRLGRPLDDLDALRAARGLRAPLLVIHDEEDRAVPVSAGRSLAEAWPGAELHLTRGLGHGRILRHAETIECAIAFVTGAAGARANVAT